MSRPRRKAAIKCDEKLHMIGKRNKTQHITNRIPSSEENKIQSCTVQINKKDTIPVSMINEDFLKRCSIKLSKSDMIPVTDISNISKHCVYMPLTKNNQFYTKRGKAKGAVKTTIAKGKNVFDFVPRSPSPQSSEDNSMKNVIQQLQTKCSVRIVRGQHKIKASKNNLHKTWSEKNIRKAKRLIKPKINKLHTEHIIEAIQKDVVIPIKKANLDPISSNNESVLPLIDDMLDDDHFKNNDDDAIHDELFISNIENINPIPSVSNTEIVHAKPLLRSPLKPLNAELINRPKLTSKKNTSILRNQLLKRSLFNQSRILSSPKQMESQGIIEDANATNYFGFTSDLTPDPSIKKSIHQENTSTPVRPLTMESLVAKLKTLKAGIKYSKVKSVPRTSTRTTKKPVKKLIELPDDTTINFKDVLSSTLVQPTSIINKNLRRRTYSRNQIKDVDTEINRIQLKENVPECLDFEQLRQSKNPLGDTHQKTSPLKKTVAKVYKKNKKKPQEDPQLLSFYKSFNMECQEISNCKLIIE